MKIGLYKHAVLISFIFSTGPLLIHGDEPDKRVSWKTITLAGAEDRPAPGADQATALDNEKNYFVKKKDSVAGLGVKVAKLTSYGGKTQLYVAVNQKDALRLRQFFHSHVGGYIALMCVGNLLACAFVQTDDDIRSDFTISVASKEIGNRLLQAMEERPK